MPTAVLRVVDVYPYRIRAEGIGFLVLRRAPGRPYPGQWRMVGGKVREGETGHAAARRELREETGCEPRCFWALPSVNVFYEWQTDRVNLAPAFAAEIGGDPALDAEHDAFAWLPAEEAAARLRWPEQRRLLRLAASLLEQGIPPELIVPG